MRVKQKQQGYTIVEVMLFLAISSFMFVVAAVAISGKQATAEFKQGTTSTNDQIRQVINDVSNGTFDTDTALACPSGDGSVHSQGQNKGCIFVGKILQFNNATGNYTIYNLSGNQFTDSTNIASVPTDLHDSAPQVFGASTSGKLKWGVQVNKMIDNVGTNPVVATPAQINSIAFIKSFTNSSSANQNQEVLVVPIPSSKTSPTDMSNYLTNVTLPTKTDITVCLSDGGAKNAYIVIGGSAGDNNNGQRTTTDLNIGTGAGC